MAERRYDRPTCSTTKCCAERAKQPNDIFNAEKEFQHALGLDPDFALAYAGLADCYLTGGVAPRTGWPIKKLVQKALALDESFAEAHPR